MKNKIIATVLVLVTLISIFVIPASAKSNIYSDQSSFDISILSFIHDSNNKVIVYNQDSGPMSLRDYFVNDTTFLPFTTTSMKNLYVFCDDSSSSFNDSLIDINPDFDFKQLVVYLYFPTYAPKGSDINLDLSMYSQYFSKFRVQLIDEDMKVLSETSTGCGTASRLYDAQAYTLFNGLGLSSQIWKSDNWSYGVNAGKGLISRETNLKFHYEFDTATEVYGMKLIFDIGSYQNSYWFNFNNCKISLNTPGNDGYTSEFKQYVEYTDNLWQNVLIFFQNVGIFFQNVSENIIANFKSLPNNLKTWFNNVVTGISNLPQNIADKIGGFFGGIGESIGNYFKDTYLGQVFQITGALKDFLNNNNASGVSMFNAPNGSGDSSDTTSSDFSNLDDNEIYQNPDIPGYLDYEYWQSVGE